MACSHEMNVVKYIINNSLNKFLGEKQQSQLSSGQAEEEAYINLANLRGGSLGVSHPTYNRFSFCCINS